MRFESSDKVESVIWNSRIADLPRATNRAIINRLFNGDPPFDPTHAEENNIEVNRNFLEGPRIMTDARTQWNSNFLKPGNRFTMRPLFGPDHKRQEWAHVATNSANRLLRKNRKRVADIRSTGASTLLHGIGPAVWPDRRSVVPDPIPIGSLLIPSETDIEFENLQWFAVFREYTASMLYEKTHGPKVDPGWNIELVNQQLKWVLEQDQKTASATSQQYMPERIEELIKQDTGYFGTDAVPTVDLWDFYFREDDKGWYRRMIMDWGLGDAIVQVNPGTPPENTRSGSTNRSGFIYSSGDRKYADDWSEILHCQFGDCSCVAPFKYHSVRSLGWMLWGICDIQNRLRCKITEQAFSDLLWWFRTASENDLTRIRKAMFLHMGAIPAGVDFIKAGERYSPDPKFVGLVLEQNRQLMSENSASFTRDTGENQQKEMTATEVMARTNSVNTLVSGVMNLAYTFEEFKVAEMARRLFIRNSPDKDARQFRKDCLQAGIDPRYMSAEAWETEVERSVGSGNKTVEMAVVSYLNAIRKNLGPDAQRKVDHMGIEIVTEQADLAEDLAPIKAEERVSASTHDAELATERLMRGLPFTPPKFAVLEDYVVVWLKDMAMTAQQIQQAGGTGTPEQVRGLMNVAAAVKQYIDIMSQNDEEAPKARQYDALLTQLNNHIRGFAQRLQQQAKANGAANGNGNPLAETAAKIQGIKLMAQAKAANARESHAQRTAQKQVAFELGEARKDRETAADIRRKSRQHTVDMVQDLQSNRLNSLQE